MNEDLFQGFLLGDLRVAPQQRKVTRPNGVSHLSPKAVEVLLCLAGRPGELWTRDDLLHEVWGAGHGSQEALNHVISSLRHALDDHPDDPRYIQTVPKRGYRLLGKPVAFDRQAPVSPADAPENSAGDSPKILHELKRRGVVETGLAYLVLGWLLIQVADVTFDQLMLPEWWGTFVTVLVIAGFPVALLLAWFLEIVGGHIMVDRQHGSRSAMKIVSRTFVSVVGALTVAFTGVYVYDQTIGLPTRDAALQTQATGLERSTPIEPNSIAVLEFMNIDGSEETEVFSNGLAEDVMSRLAKVPSLYVSARGDSFSLPPNASSADVRKRLRVSYYLEGSVRLTDRLLRVVIHLIDSENGFRLLSRSFNRDRTAFFEIQDEITNLTVANLRLMLPPETQAVTGTPAENPNLDAYILYRRGMDALHRPITTASIEEALDWFMRSLSLDPEFAAAHAGICATYAQGFNVVNDAAYIEKAEKSCAAAINYNPNLDVVHSALGDLYSKTGRNRDAEAEYQRALEINVNSVAALSGLANVYDTTQRLQEAEAMYLKAIGIQPGNWSTYYDLGTFLFQSGRYGEAVEQFRKIISIDSSNMQGYSSLGGALMLSGNFAEAASAFERAIEVQPSRNAYSNLGLLYYYLGQMDDAVAAHKKAIELAPNDHLVWSNLGDALSFTTKKNLARAAFRKARELAENHLAVNPVDAGPLIDLAWIEAMLGNNEKARELASRAMSITPGDPYVHYVSALISARLGETTAAYQELQAAVDLGFPLELMAAEPHLKSIQHAPRFVALTRQQVAGREPEK